MDFQTFLLILTPASLPACKPSKAYWLLELSVIPTNFCATGSFEYDQPCNWLPFIAMASSSH